MSLVLLFLSIHISVVVISPVPGVIVAVDIAGVVVDADRHLGGVKQELDPVDQQLQGDEVTEPGGQTVSTPHHYGDVGQSNHQSNGKGRRSNPDQGVDEQRVKHGKDNITIVIILTFSGYIMHNTVGLTNG